MEKYVYKRYIHIMHLIIYIVPRMTFKSLPTSEEFLALLGKVYGIY